MNTDPYANPFVLAHVKRCHLCQRHDRLVASGSQYRNEVELERFADHIRVVLARHKQDTEDAALRADYDRVQLR
ncbi:hypothetical protein LCGC14_2419430 [marine sediment metagenome]|uniref:Uncharacterized protein n=1 Tax=marine sediment metagenome TaxID=412755 RepID=A0A0F9CCA4_9ZZZZ